MWQFSGVLLERRKITDTLRDLRQAAVGLPVRGPTAIKVTQQTDTADARHEELDADVKRRLAQLSTLATECRRLHAEHNAVLQAKEVVRSAGTTLGRAGGHEPDQSGECAERAARVLSAYRSLVQGLQDVRTS